MAANLTLNLTDDQQRQIRDVTGKSISQLIINIGDGQLPDQALDQVSGGLIGLLNVAIGNNGTVATTNSGGITNSTITDGSITI